MASEAAYADWLRGIDDYVRWTQQAIANMRQGVRRGYTSPRSVVERMLPILERLSLDDSANVFYAPLRSMPDDFRAVIERAMSPLPRDRFADARALRDALLELGKNRSAPDAAPKLA